MTAPGGDAAQVGLAEAGEVRADLAGRQAGAPRQSPLAVRVGLHDDGPVQRLAARIVPYLSQRAQYVGRTGVAGVALLVFSLVLFLSANAPLRQQLAALRSGVAQTQQQSARQRTSEGAAPPAQLEAFVRKLPARSELPAITEKVVAQAGAAGLVLESGRYDFTVTHSGEIVRARLGFPLQGTYPAIRQFIEGTLAAIPNAAVDGLKLERKEIGSAEVSADVRFAVYLRNVP